MKTKECKKVLQLMDQDFEYQRALKKVLSESKNTDKKTLENELNLYI